MHVAAAPTAPVAPTEGLAPTPPAAPGSPRILPADAWRALEAAHAARADALTAGRRARVARGQTHPVDDFLYTYYSYKPAVLRRWHPGADVVLADAAATDRARWRGYRTVGPNLTVDVAGFVDEKRALLRAVHGILRATALHRAEYGCFGLHEWAMVYRQGEHRHPIPLRLGQDGTDAVVDGHRLTCTHHDAFRFFTPAAVPRNRTAPTRADQEAVEQPGCLHANMDLYKWAVKLGPLTPGDLLLDAFTLAREIREVDMRASPYDLSAHGYTPIAIETTDGKAAYVAAQRAFADRAAVLRARLLGVVEHALG
ncbi:3-methyladenine DNA glycosylase [Microbacterium telephonicum]|uniref:3-methyladenine DNA glycosylase n=1 Tax=Microbacterium telephonicum TaxID=1714841 RepID=A0A498CFK6_9MICO|nr:3-methyladenine DNA glycosylase [Microbacterium telephonicum]RLK52130.1 hypothetical protein C7474_0057 [Microbacterium telephonicum]